MVFKPGIIFLYGFRFDFTPSVLEESFCNNEVYFTKFLG